MVANTPYIYVASLADYNLGRLHGAWIDATMDAEDIHEAIQDMLDESELEVAETWAVHSYNDFHGVDLGEHPTIEAVVKVVQLLEEHGALAGAVIDYYGIHYLDDAEKALSDKYLGSYESLGDWARDYLDMMGVLAQVPKELRDFYIKFDEYGEDKEGTGEIMIIYVGNDLHVFSNR